MKPKLWIETYIFVFMAVLFGKIRDFRSLVKFKEMMFFADLDLFLCLQQMQKVFLMKFSNNIHSAKQRK